MKYLRLLCALGIALIASVVLMPNANSIGVSPTVMYHYAPDDGLDPPILVHCGAPTPPATKVHEIAEGQTYTCKNAAAVYVPSGQEIWCYNLGWHKFLDATGFHYPITSGMERGCTIRAD